MRVLALLRGDPGLRQPDRLGAFVNSVCNHVLQEHYRSKKRTEATIDDETESTIPGREPSALRLLEAKDTERVVRKILNELPERDRRLREERPRQRPGAALHDRPDDEGEHPHGHEGGPGAEHLHQPADELAATGAPGGAQAEIGRRGAHSAPVRWYSNRPTIHWAKTLVTTPITSRITAR